MKKLALVLLFSGLIFCSYGSDIIQLKNGSHILARIVETDGTDITFYAVGEESLSGKLLYISKSIVSLVIFEGGKTETFQYAKIPLILSDSAQLCEQAKLDAKANFKANGPFWGTLCFTGGTNPVFGVIWAAIMASTKPKESNWKMPYTDNVENPYYKECYGKEAHKIKKRKTWTGFGAGCAIYAVALAILFGVVASS